MNKLLLLIVSLAASALFTAPCRAQSDAPYTEGPVWTITMVKAKYGMGDDYLKGLAKSFKGTLDEAKKQGLVMDYKILLGDAATPQDFNILLMVESKNMAALDNGREKFDPIARKIGGDTGPTAYYSHATSGNSRDRGRQGHARSDVKIAKAEHLLLVRLDSFGEDKLLPLRITESPFS